MTLNGPITSHIEKHCQWMQMSPMLPMEETADGPGPFMPMKKAAGWNCWWLRISPFQPMKTTADDLEWAHCCTWRKLPISTNGRIPACAEKLSMTLSVSIIADEDPCWWARIGSFLPTQNTANEWAHHYPWKKLPDEHNGPNFSSNKLPMSSSSAGSYKNKSRLI